MQVFLGSFMGAVFASASDAFGTFGFDRMIGSALLLFGNLLFIFTAYCAGHSCDLVVWFHWRHYLLIIQILTH